MGRVSYKNTLEINKVGVSPKLNAVLCDMGCITIGDVLDVPIIKLLKNKTLLSIWEEYIDFILRVQTAKDRANK